MSTKPAEILGLPKGRLTPGADADLVLFDPDKKWVVDPAAFRSKSRNTPFGGLTLFGKAICTVVGGQIIYKGV
jgi:dihydroorotase